MSVHSVLASDPSTVYGHPALDINYGKDTLAPLPKRNPKPYSLARQRTYSTPYPFEPSPDGPKLIQSRHSGSSRTTTEIPRSSTPSTSHSRIPKPATRTVSASQAVRRANPPMSFAPSLLEEEIGPPVNGTSSYSSSQEELDRTITEPNALSGLSSTSASTPHSFSPSEAAEYEHWYRGEGRDGGGRNGGRGEISAGTQEMLKIAMGGHTLRQGKARPESIVLNDSFRSRKWQEGAEWGDVRNEEPLTDMEVDGDATDAETPETPRTPIHAPSPPLDSAHPLALRPYTPPTPVEPVHAPEPVTPKASTRTAQQRKKSSAAGTTPTRSRVRRKASLPAMSATASSRSAYDLSSVSAFADAVPHWDNQPDIPPSGNWDEVILPTVAKKMRMANEDPTTELQVLGTSRINASARKPELIPPAPGTFDYDETKAHPRNRPTEMQQFGVYRPVLEEEPELHSATEEPIAVPHNTSVAIAPASSQTSRPISIVVPTPPPSKPDAVNSEKTRQGFKHKKPSVKVTPPSVDSRLANEDDEHSGGCCKCLIM